MYSVEMYVQVRRACMVEGMSVREASRVFGLHHAGPRQLYLPVHLRCQPAAPSELDSTGDTTLTVGGLDAR